MIAIVALVHGLSHFFQLILVPLFPWLIEDFGFSFTELGLLMTVFFVVSGFGQSAAGFLVDRVGAVPVLVGSLAMYALGCIVIASGTGWWTIAFGMTIMGLANAPFHPVDFSIMNSRVREHRLGRAYAAHGVSGSLGWAAAPVFLAGIASVAGWRIAVLAAGMLSLCALVLVLARWELLAGSRRLPPAAVARTPEATAAKVFDFLRLPAVWLSFTFFAVLALALGGVQSFAPAAAGVLHGLDRETIALCLTAYMLGNAAGMLLGGFAITDPARAEGQIALGFGVAALVSASMFLVDWSAWAVPLVFVALGTAAGFANPARDLLIRRIAPPGATGRVYGVVYSGLDVGMALGPLGFGLLMDHGHPMAVWISIAMLQAALIAFAFTAGAAGRPARVTA